MGSETQLARKCLFMPTFSAAILTCKVSQTDLVFGVRSGSLVGLCMQDYKSLCAAAMIRATPVNNQIHSILTSLYEQHSQLS